MSRPGEGRVGLIGLGLVGNAVVRRMTAAVGFPTLRLIRYAIGDWTLTGLQPGEYSSQTISHFKQATVRKTQRKPQQKRNKSRNPLMR